MKRVIRCFLYIMMFVFLTGCAGKADQRDHTEEIKDGADSVAASFSENPAGTNEPEALRKLYVDFPQTANYQEAVSVIQESELPYAEKKQNGSRYIKIALEKSDTAMEDAASNTFEDYDYIEISYLYPKQENDNNDELEKYSFAGILYVSSKGNYQLESHAESTFITMEGEVIDSGMDRQEQVDFLKEHTGSDINERGFFKIPEMARKMI